LANAVGCSQKRISDLERGANWTHEWREKIESALGVEDEFLLVAAESMRAHEHLLDAETSKYPILRGVSLDAAQADDDEEGYQGSIRTELKGVEELLSAYYDDDWMRGIEIFLQRRIEKLYAQALNEAYFRGWGDAKEDSGEERHAMSPDPHTKNGADLLDQLLNNPERLRAFAEQLQAVTNGADLPRSSGSTPEDD
jgi:hypothetical protein